MVGIDTVQSLYNGMLVVHGMDSVKRDFVLKLYIPVKKFPVMPGKGILKTFSMTS